MLTGAISWSRGRRRVTRRWPIPTVIGDRGLERCRSAVPDGFRTCWETDLFANVCGGGAILRRSTASSISPATCTAGHLVSGRRSWCSTPSASIGPPSVPATAASVRPTSGPFTILVEELPFTTLQPAGGPEGSQSSRTGNWRIAVQLSRARRRSSSNSTAELDRRIRSWLRFSTQSRRRGVMHQLASG